MRALKTVTRTQGNNLALKDGSVTPRGFSFEFEEVPVLVDAFRRMVREQEFDVSELAFTTYLCAKAHGKPITALPIFLARGFHHGAIVHSGASAAAGLEGRRVGVNRGYTVTTGVWARGILADHYGVDLDKVTWVLSGDEHVAEYRPPANVVPMAPGGDLATMVATGELAAAIGVTGPGLVPLVPDAGEVAFEALRRDGLYPINHLVVVRDELAGLAAEVFAAFAEAKRRYVERLPGIADPTPTDLMYRRVSEVTDPLPYGIAPNRAMIDLLIDHAVRQRILDRRPAVEDLFAPDTLDLTA
ncbi:hypothetical protein [Actinophytocola sp.]|jgi:4,5-dihydroxyphthalate decarboxylase|uniref:hypothetical protein n=1 Tax=Actinophytocola sp. TaxID=1872138 RepID=UPI002ED825DA